jgi:uncharacterized protein DUF1569
MPPLLHDPAVRASILARVGKLTPDTKHQWGKMTVDQMLWHVSQSLAQSLGQIPSMPNRVPVPKWLSKFVAFNFPWPKGAPTPADLVAVDHYGFESQRRRCMQLVGTFTAKDLSETWTPSASFGRLTGREWSRFQAKHVDHHLRQFGV